MRRRADLSQRELAEASGVPQATVARIESGRARDPRIRTVERLIRAAGGRLGVSSLRDEVTATAPEPRYEERRDEGGRRYPAHLDVREVRTLKDWPGAWWAHWYNLPPERWPLRVPELTYDLDRGRRDRRRLRERAGAAVRLRRAREGLPATSWRLVAELPGGELVGELRAHERSEDLLLGEDQGDRREIVLDGVVVAPQLRFLGIGRRLVELLGEEMGRAGIRTAHAVAEMGGVDFLLACGYELEASRPAALRLDRPDPR